MTRKENKLFMEHNLGKMNDSPQAVENQYMVRVEMLLA